MTLRYDEDGNVYIKHGYYYVKGKKKIHWTLAESKLCEKCGKPFFASPYKGKNYCSLSCRNKVSAGHRIARKKLKKCVICRRPFLVPRFEQHKFMTCGGQGSRCWHLYRKRLGRKRRQQTRIKRKSAILER